MGAQWVFVEKRTADGKFIKLKARYVAKGYAQIAGVEFLDTFAPTATFVSLRLLLTIAAKCNWPVYSFDFVAAYLHLPIDEEIWVRPPEGLNVPKGYTCKLQKALYGTKQAARCWWKHLQKKLKDLGYTPSQFDSSLYILQHSSHKGAIWVHVDDGVVLGSSDKILRQLEKDLQDCLEIKWQSGVETIVGVEVTRGTGSFSLRQKKLIDKILEDHWDKKSLAKTPLPTNYSAETENPDGDPTQSSAYLSVVGGLSYLAVGTRPDIAFAVNYMARFSACPAPVHWKALRHVVNYLANTKDRFLQINPRDSDKPLKCYSDAGWGVTNISIDCLDGEYCLENSQHHLINQQVGGSIAWTPVGQRISFGHLSELSLLIVRTINRLDGGSITRTPESLAITNRYLDSIVGLTDQPLRLLQLQDCYYCHQVIPICLRTWLGHLMMENNKNVPPKNFMKSRARKKRRLNDRHSIVSLDIIATSFDGQRIIWSMQQCIKRHLYPEINAKNKSPPRKPTAKELAHAHAIVDDFIPFTHGKVILIDRDAGQVVAVIEFIPISELTATEKAEINRITTFLHKWKKFVYPIAAGRGWGGRMWGVV
ncbi:hypothetical protein PtA15_5A312 [Puccinia triticina]|uniref:Reverse transcriptase Ty1/copia-type domain-containing protein n=1 Tax=Puccinia triticina TaxID=208348 RepID=A0ABY7CHZ7_9BASI|nr:uncharacterized protein PtA15_5A312 [Puccinia triticina]WAQ84739.1 hypothetical protein PtA15_5A312 [Puccinia triticina]